MKQFLQAVLFFTMFITLHAERPKEVVFYRARDFSYLLGKTPGLSADLLSMHLTLYRGYVKNTNALLLLIEKMRRGGEDLTLRYGAIERRLAWEMDGMILHELYFENLGGNGKQNQLSPLYKQIVSDFGSFEAWKQNFIATGMIRGVGWVILYQDPIKKRLQNIWIDEHHKNHLAGARPILVLDVWEHAYLTQYGLDRKGYIHAFFQNIDWGIIEKRFSPIKKDIREEEGSMWRKVSTP